MEKGKEKQVEAVKSSVRCYWASKKNVNDYNKECGEKIVSQCSNEATWHDTYCAQHHKEGWGRCTCHPPFL